MNAAFDWSHYLDLAHELAACPSDDALVEAKQRCAVSRAYYSVLIRARNYLKRKDRVRTPAQNTHTFVIDQYLNSGSQDRQDIGDNLHELRKYRTRADYEDSVPHLGPFVDYALELARDTAKLLGSSP